MAVPVVVLKAVATAATSKKGRNVLAVLIAALLMPIIIVILMICALVSGTESANQSLLDYNFKGAISQDFTDEQRNAIENMQDWLVELDTVIVENEEEYSLDGDMVRAVFYCLQFGAEIAKDYDYSGFCECFDGSTMEQLDNALQNIKGKFPQYEITGNIKGTVQKVYEYLKQ